MDIRREPRESAGETYCSDDYLEASGRVFSRSLMRRTKISGERGCFSVESKEVERVEKIL